MFKIKIYIVYFKNINILNAVFDYTHSINERRKNNTIKGVINEANYSELQNWRA